MSTGIVSRNLANRRDRSSADYLPASGQVQNVQNSRIYVFGDNQVSEHDFEQNGQVEMAKIRSRSGETSVAEKKIDTIDKQIVPGDTLQSFAIQYGCTVSQLKQLNNLMTEQDFFARQEIKVPIKRYGILSELREKEEPEVSLDQLTDEEDDQEEGEHCDIRTISIGNALRGDNSQAALFLKEMDQDLEKIRKSTLTQKQSLDEVVSTLTTKSIQPMQKKSKFLDGASCGITWKGIVLTIFIVTILIPLCALFFYWKKT